MRGMLQAAARWAAVGSMAATLALAQAPVTSPWAEPAAALADQVAALMGPGEARLTIENRSTLDTAQIPAIRKLLQQDLKAHGIQAAGAESANAIRVTLSENARERLWVADVIQGNQTQVAMVRVEAGAAEQAHAAEGLLLRSQRIFGGHEPVLAAAEIAHELVVLEPEQIVIYAHEAAGWREVKRAALGVRRPLGRDARGELIAATDGAGLEAWTAGARCTIAQSEESWTIACHESDDPWPLARAVNGNAGLSGFYNAARNFFTGVVTPGVGVDLPAFYAAAMIPRPAGDAALLISGTDGKAQMVSGNALRAVSGVRDWGSDFAVVHSGCGAGWQVVASGSGEAAQDSLRAYELPALEARPVSAPLAMEGTVMALETAPDGASALAVVRDAQDEYEVDRVTAMCP